MNSKALTQTNPYLKDSVQQEKLNRISARTSSGVEGVWGVAENYIEHPIQRREKSRFKKFKAKFVSD